MLVVHASPRAPPPCRVSLGSALLRLARQEQLASTPTLPRWSQEPAFLMLNRASDRPTVAERLKELAFQLRGPGCGLLPQFLRQRWSTEVGKMTACGVLVFARQFRNADADQPHLALPPR